MRLYRKDIFLKIFSLWSVRVSKKLLLVTSPPACGKTRLSRRIAAELYGSVYLDKDSLIPLSKRIFSVARKPYNRSSEFFKREIRDYEYEAILDIASEALKYNDTVILNAPFTSELRDEEYMARLRKKINYAGAKLVIIWIESDEDTCFHNMKRRNSDRDRWKLSNWSDYIKNVNFSAPENLGDALLCYNGKRNGGEAEGFENLVNDIKQI